MINFYKFCKKKNIIVSFLIFLCLGLYLNFKYNLPNTVEFITGIILDAKIKSNAINIDLKNDKIVIKQLVIQDKNDIIVKVPEVNISYSLKEMRVKKIEIDGGEATIVRRKNGTINIVSAFTGDSPKKNDQEEKKSIKEYTPGIAVPIDKIDVKNVTTIFRDESYGAVIEEKINDTNGYVTFSKTKGIDLQFKGHNNSQLFEYSFNNYKEPYSMNIKLKNIKVNPTLLQYGYEGEYISCDKGMLNMDLLIASSGMLGWIDFNGVELEYKDLNEIIKDINGRVDFNEKGIFLKADGIVFGKKEKFSLKYENKELDMGFHLKNISQKDIEKLSYLSGINLPFKDSKIDEVKFNLNYKKELKINIEALVKNLDIENSDINLKDTKVDFVYDDKGIQLKNFTSTLNYLNKEGNPSIVEKLEGTFSLLHEKGRANFKIKNINDIKYVPDINGNLDFEIRKDMISFNFLSNILSLKGEYLKKDDILKLKDDKKYNFEYSLKDKKIINANGKLGIEILKNRFLIDFNGKNNLLNIKSISLFNELGVTKNLLSAKIDFNQLKYDISMTGEEFKLHNFLDDKNEKLLEGSITGTINGEKKLVKSNLQLKKLNLSYIVDIKNITGNLSFDNSKKNVEVEFLGEIGKIGYKKYSTEGLFSAFRYKNDIFEIKSFNNEYIKLKGKIDLKNDRIDIISDINNLPLSKFDVEIPKITVKNLKTKLYGKVSDFKGDIRPDILIEINDATPITITGNIEVSKNKLATQNLKINNSVFKGEYSLKTNDYWLKGNIIQEDIGKYYGNSKLKYRVIGLLNVSGNKKNIVANIKSTIDKIYVAGSILPNLYIEGTYRSDELIDGTLIVDEVLVSNTKLKKLLEAYGVVDLKNKNINFELPNQNIDFKSLQQYIPVKDIEGNLNLKGNVAGDFNNIKYNLLLFCNRLKIKDVELNKIRAKLMGDLDKANLEEFSFVYLNNKFSSKGEYNLLEDDYNFTIKSDKIDLSFLNVFLNKYDVSDIKGKLEANFQLNKKENKGYLKIENFGLKSDKMYLKLKGFNSTIILEDKKMYVDNLVGNLNDGQLKFKGDILLPTLDEIKRNPYFYEKLQYQANLSLKDVVYKYDKYFQVVLDSEFNLKNKKLFGSIEIIKGDIFNIPSQHESIFQKIKDLLFSSASKTINNSEKLGKGFEINTVFANSMDVDIRIKIKEGVKLKIDEVMSLVNDVNGNILGNGVITGSNGKYVFLGNFEMLGGSLSINDNVFNLSRVLVIFNDRKAYFPKVNPTILLDANVQVQNENMEISLNGPLDNLRFNIITNNGNSSGNLNSLLTGEETGQNANEITATLLTNIIGGQITQILNPISRIIKNVFGLSKFRITSNFINEDKNNLNNGQEQSKFRLGAILEAEDNLYKDKLWWIAKVNILGENRQDMLDNIRGSEVSNNNGIKDFDFSLEYRFDNTKTFSVGVNKVTQNINTGQDKYKENKLNYHIDFKFQKKYDNLLNIFINK